MVIEDEMPLLEEILSKWQLQIGKDYQGYKNHLYRLVNFCFALHACSEEDRTKITIAACFHDLGIWTSSTFDYLPPSMALAQAYLQQANLMHWLPEVLLMIEMHHKLGNYDDARYPLVELFRKGDLVDLSLGLIKCGLPSEYIRRVKGRFPNAGFHKRLLQLEVAWLPQHPFNPLPVVKW
jgi:hypothetical protein